MGTFLRSQQPRGRRHKTPASEPVTFTGRDATPAEPVKDEAAERFARDTAKHRMIVKHDDGLYRHLRFVEHRFCNDAEYRPNSSFYWFDLITWPGCLTINGDCGAFTFARTDDMFEFFRGASRYGINPGYWAEKVRAQNPAGVKTHSASRFRQQVAQAVEEAGRDFYPGLAQAVEEQFYGPHAEWNIDYPGDAERALADFRFVPEGVLCPVCKEDGVATMLVRDKFPNDNTLICPEKCGTNVEPFRFTETWEWDLTDYDWQYLWCCHAIVWGIAQYDAARTAAA